MWQTSKRRSGNFPRPAFNARQFGFRTIVSVPLLRESQAIGALQLRRTEVAAFADQTETGEECVRLARERRQHSS
jgi:hypothetical protein